MSTPVWAHFYCPKCNKRFAKDSPEVSKRASPGPPSTGLRIGGPLPGYFPCPECGEQIELAGVFQGRYDNPHFSRKSCLLWIVGIGAALFVLKWILTALEGNAPRAPKTSPQPNDK